MTTIRVKVQNLDRIKLGFKLAPRKMTRNLQRAIERSTFKIQRESKDIIRTGRGYSRRPFDSGNLFRTIFTDIKPLSGRVFANADYAIYVHEGLSTSTKYGPRPFFADAAEEANGFIQAEFNKAVTKTLSSIR